MLESLSLRYLLIQGLCLPYSYTAYGCIVIYYCYHHVLTALVWWSTAFCHSSNCSLISCRFCWLCSSRNFLSFLYMHKHTHNYHSDSSIQHVHRMFCAILGFHLSLRICIIKPTELNIHNLIYCF